MCISAYINQDDIKEADLKSLFYGVGEIKNENLFLSEDLHQILSFGTRAQHKVINLLHFNT